MTIKLVNRGKEGEVLLEGTLDTLAAPETEAILDQLTQRYDRLIVNMIGVDYIFSPGLRLLKKAHLTMQHKGGELIVSYVSKEVMEVFELAGFSGLLNFQNV